MSDWAKDIHNALHYIETHLTGDLDIRDIAKRASVSPFYFQRIFTALCGISVGEYIRNRRLTLAGEELLRSHVKVIDIAAKYGYDSPDSFNRAFQRFHGIPPSAARKTGAPLRSFGPLRIQPNLEGGGLIEYKIVEKPQFTVVGLSAKFNTDTSYQEIPKFWDAVIGMESVPVYGMYGICMDLDGKDFEYLIADNYIPRKEIPAGCVTKVIPASVWAVFPCCLRTLQDVNTQMWSEWLPNCKNYRLTKNLNIELYAPPAETPEETYCEIWLPVEPI